MASETHTPGEWREEPLPNGQIGIRADNHGYVVIVETSGPNPDRNAAQIANAAFIVRAANSHDELVAALKAVISVADRKTVEFDMARAALAKAESR